jgi:succinate-semialdehyde dehydrogenase / glutarate-semialdehyde dehydrogenase
MLKDYAPGTPSDAYIGGVWVEADQGLRFAVTNKATGQVIAQVPNMTAVETRRAIEAAEGALPAWRARTAAQRAEILQRWATLMLKQRDELARLLTLEQGKPLAESQAEIAYAASFLQWFAEEGRRVYGDIIPPHQPDKRIMVLKQGVGVACGITPWNFPSAMVTRKAAPALAAGCTFVLKPAEHTPLSALAVAALGEQAGVPNGVFNVVTCDKPGAAEIGAEMTSNPVVRKVAFTGSTATGKVLMKQCADHMKRISLELGGNAPFIVFDDADFDAALEGALICKFRNSGQTCISANRIFVQRGIHARFAASLAERAAGLTVGGGLEPGVQQGPLISLDAIAKVERHIADAQARGARLLTGGKRHKLGGTFFEPTVLDGIDQEMELSSAETFGPVAALRPFDTEGEVVGLANDTPYGLAAYVYTENNSRVWRLSEALESGIVGMNTGLISTEVAPFGGMKHSGFGREGSKYGIEDWVEVKYVCVGIRSAEGEA